MILIDSKFTKPTFFENWLLWIYSQSLGRYEWTNTKKAVRLGGGFCSQHAIVFNNILRDQNMESRIIGLNGHIVNEVFVGGEWKVYDPTFNIVFEASLKKLEDNPEIVYHAYRMVGRTHEEAKYLQKIFASHEDNWHFPTSKHYDVKKYIIEVFSLYAIWCIPILFIFVGLILNKKM